MDATAPNQVEARRRSYDRSTDGCFPACRGGLGASVCDNSPAMNGLPMAAFARERAAERTQSHDG
jgi:hypothetical protein